MSTVPPAADLETDYPESDGRPMAETPLHRDLMFLVIEMLRHWYAGNAMVYVSGNMFLYYEPGNRRRRVSPDVQVTLGIPAKPERRVYRTWVEGKPPDTVFELTSASTQREDEETKFELYRRIGVREYFLFDPTDDYLDESPIGYRLEDGEYVPIAPRDGRLPSEILKLHLEREGTLLRLYDPICRKWVPTPAEVIEGEQKRIAVLEAAAQREAEARRQAEAELTRLRAEIDALRNPPPAPNP